MAKLYFLGGENIVRRDAREINRLAFQDAGGTPAVLVFPWARASFDRAFSRRKRLFNYFRSLGARTVTFAEYSESRGEIAEAMGHSDVVYLTGGQLSVLIARLKSKGVDELLRGYKGVVVGRSAGALALGRLCPVKDRNKGAAKTVLGLGLVDISVKVHYKPSADSELLRLSKSGKVYALPEGAALVFNNGLMSFVGDVFLFENGEKNAVNKA